MKWLIVFTLLPLLSLGQKVEDFWYFRDYGYKSGYNGFYRNSKDSITFYHQGHIYMTRNILTHNYKDILDTIDSTFIKKVYYEFNESGKVNFYNHDLELNSPINSSSNSHYFSRTSAVGIQKFTFKDSAVETNAYFDSTAFNRLIIRTDKDLNYTSHFASHLFFIFELIEIMEKDSNLIIFCTSTFPDTGGEWKNVKDSFQEQTDSVLSLKIIEINNDLNTYRVFDYNKSQNKNKLASFNIYPNSLLNTFSYSKHLMPFYWRKSQNEFYSYEIRNFEKNYNSYLIDSFHTNMEIISVENLENNLFFTANITEREPVIVNGSSLNNSVNSWDYSVLGRINKENKVEIITTIDSTYNAYLFKQDEEVWLKYATHNEVTWQGNTFVPKTSVGVLIHYFRLNKNGEFNAHSVGPEFVLQNNDLEDLLLYQNKPALSNGYIYDLSNAHSVFYIGDSSFYQNDQSQYNPVWTKSSIRELPIEQPIATETHSCSNISLNLKYFDADHYTIIASSDSITPILNDGQGFNYAKDYLLAPKYKNGSVLYQGNDTTVHFKNFISNKSYYLHIIPGLGVNTNTTYNSNAALVLKIMLPKSNIQIGLFINPERDISICDSDTIFATATSTYPIRWMDGKTESQRFVPETGEYYFTIKDSQGCVMSSDTVSITKHPMPKINRIVASKKRPYCLGDSVWFAANSFQLGAHPDSVKYASKAIQTGWYVVKLTNRYGCQSIDSTYVEFGQKPNFKFLQDSVLSFDRKLRVRYSTNADSLQWVYNNDSIDDYNYFLVTDSQYLFVNAFDEYGCNIWDSILTMYKEPISEAFPNAFTPNEDGINDVWFFIHPDTAGVLSIYDRWGGIVHHGKNQWNGKKHGETLPIGTYRYMFRFTENGEEKVRRGMISLIR